ncbi:DUF5615 family PIN-like protein [Candidatus Uhrbacteria bacterium]|nr:DUF5615 family PIN-like protein [Candidatus Uhrbacteria bacterium]
MSSSTRKPRLLLDENVRFDLYRYVQNEGYDVVRSAISTSDHLLAKRTIKERRILVTNDQDFLWYPRHTIFSVIILRIPQYDGSALLSSFSKLMAEEKKFQGFAFILYPGSWDKEKLA